MPKGIPRKTIFINTLRGQARLLDSWGGRTKNDVRVNPDGRLFVWMSDYEGRNTRIFLPQL